MSMIYIYIFRYRRRVPESPEGLLATRGADEHDGFPSWIHGERMNMILAAIGIRRRFILSLVPVILLVTALILPMTCGDAGGSGTSIHHGASTVRYDTRSDVSNPVKMALFFDPDCPCNEEIMNSVIPSIEENFSRIEVFSYDVTTGNNEKRSLEFQEAYNVPLKESTDFPFIYIGDHFFSYEDIEYDQIATTIGSYGNTTVPLWPEWNVTWSTEVALFHNSSETYLLPSGRTAIQTMDLLDINHIRLTVYDTFGNPRNQSLLAEFLKKYNSSSDDARVAVFIGNASDHLIDDDITPAHLNETLLLYAGRNTRLREVTLPPNGEDMDYSICVIIFYSPTCGECHRAINFIEDMEAKYPRLNVTRYNTANVDYLKLQQDYYEYFKVPARNKGSLAVFIGDKKYYTSDSRLKKDFEEEIAKFAEGCPCADINATDDVNVPSNFWLAVIVAGIIDGINPCAFVTLIFFTSYLLIRKRSKRQILMVGISFTSAVFLAYFLMGIGFYQLLSYLSGVSVISALLYPITGLVALIFGIYSIWDYYKVKKGKEKEMALQLPDSVKKLTRRIIRSHMKSRNLVLISFLTGILISFLEFMCTGQVYLPTIILIIAIEKQAVGYFYLLLYNIMFIWPLVLVFLAVYFGTTSKTLVAQFQKRLGLMKILMALLFFLLAAIMFYLSLWVFNFI